MSFLKRLFGSGGDDLAAYRPLWHKVVELARDPRWYREGGVADSVGGRFDAITLVLALVLLRMEREPDLIEATARVTELFVTDMDAQLRESGVGDIGVSKHMGKLMSAMGGRIEAYREALKQEGDEALVAALSRNVTFSEGADPATAAGMARAFAGKLSALDGQTVLAGAIAL